MATTGNAVRADMAADIAASGLSADQVGLIETQSCRAWHARPITGLRSELIFGTSNQRVSFECEFHDEYQGNRLGSAGLCEGSGTTWSCEAVGTLIELSFSARGICDPVRRPGAGGHRADAFSGAAIREAAGPRCGRRTRHCRAGGSVAPSHYSVTITYVGYDIWIARSSQNAASAAASSSSAIPQRTQNFNDLELKPGPA